MLDSMASVTSPLDIASVLVASNFLVLSWEVVEEGAGYMEECEVFPNLVQNSRTIMRRAWILQNLVILMDWSSSITVSGKVQA
jgi:hypothetical protein